MTQVDKLPKLLLKVSAVEPKMQCVISTHYLGVSPGAASTTPHSKRTVNHRTPTNNCHGNSLKPRTTRTHTMILAQSHRRIKARDSPTSRIKSRRRAPPQISMIKITTLKMTIKSLSVSSKAKAELHNVKNPIKTSRHRIVTWTLRRKSNLMSRISRSRKVANLLTVAMISLLRRLRTRILTKILSNLIYKKRTPLRIRP